jgi:hypothetical protein
MRKQKKINLREIDNAIAAGLLVTRYSWEESCEANGWPIDSPVTTESYLENISIFTNSALGINSAAINSDKIFSKKNLKRAGIELCRDGRIYHKGEPDIELLRVIIDLMEKIKNNNLARESKQIIQRTKQRMELDIAKRENKLN